MYGWVYGWVYGSVCVVGGERGGGGWGQAHLMLLFAILLLGIGIVVEPLQGVRHRLLDFFRVFFTDLHAQKAAVCAPAQQTRGTTAGAHSKAPSLSMWVVNVSGLLTLSACLPLSQTSTRVLITQRTWRPVNSDSLTLLKCSSERKVTSQYREQAWVDVADTGVAVNPKY